MERSTSRAVEQEHHQAPQPHRQGLEPSAADDVQRQEEHERRGWGSLDKGLLPLVASKLQENEQRDLARGRLVCRQWAAELPQGCTKLEVERKGPAGWEQRFCGLQELTWASPENAGQSWPKLKSLRLKGCRDGDLQILKHLPSLASLDLASLYNLALKGAGLKELSHLSTLTFLSLSGCSNITDAGLKELGHLSSLTSLSLSRCLQITDEGLKELKYMYSLASLDMSCCDQITDEGLKEFSHMSTLTSLNFQSCNKITDEGMKELLGQITSLAFLDLSHCQYITDEGLKELKYMSNLTSLNLERCEITDECLKDLEHVSALTYLNIGSGSQLRHSRITDAGLKSLEHMCNLASLNMAGSKITDAGLKGLEHMSALTSLDMYGCGITDEGLKELGHMSKLTYLNLAFCFTITDAGLKELGHMSKLIFLDLTFCCKITDEGLIKYLRQMSDLKSLRLTGVRITKSGRRQLMEQLPSLYFWDLSSSEGWRDGGI